MASEAYMCSCYYSCNIFLHQYSLHVVFEDEEQFSRDFRHTLFQNGCKSEQDYSIVLEEIYREVKRRRANGTDARNRKEIIRKSYSPRHPHLYALQEAYFHPKFLEIVGCATSNDGSLENLLQLLYQDPGKKIYSFPVFTDEFCREFKEEMENFEMSDMPKGRPNTMNTSGVLLEELGFYPGFIDILRAQYLNPLAEILYPEWTGTSGLRSQRAFTVKYDYETMKDDSDLSFHYDNAEVTINISLDDKCEGGELYFGQMRTEPQLSSYSKVVHKRGHGVLHRGQHMHGAMPLESGSRLNLIIWMRSPGVRNKLCPMCDNVPALVSTEGDGDGFTQAETAVNICGVL